MNAPPPTMPRMAGTVAVVTNIGSPVGQAVARRLASACMRLVLVAPDEEAVRPVLDEVMRIRALHRLTPEPLFLCADSELESGAEAICTSTLDTFGRLDALVHSGTLGLGMSHGDGALTPDVESFVPIVRAAAAAVGHAKGNVVLTGLLGGAWPGTLRDAPKAAATAAFSALTQTAATALYPLGLTLNGIVVEDPADLRLAEAGPATVWHQDRQRRSHQLNDTAHTARFLASAEARGVTGQTFFVRESRMPTLRQGSASEAQAYAHYFADLDRLHTSHRSYSA